MTGRAVSKDEELAVHFAALAAETAFNDLPAEAVAAAKSVLLDTLGDAIAGWSQPGVGPLHELVAEWGGRPESGVWAYGTRVPALNAALVNGMMCHALEFDDLHDQAHLHAFGPVLPSALALAERMGGVNGRELLTALVLGVDAMCRLGLAVKVEKGWHYTITFGVFGSALAAGRILGLDRIGLLNALGIAYSRAAGTEQALIEARLVKRLHPGLAAQAGVMAALLSQKGITGPNQPFEGRLGYFPVHENGLYDRDRALEGLGSRFEVSNLRIKPYPCCGCTHAAIDATLDLVRGTDLSAEQVAQVEVIGSKLTYDTVGAPFQIRANPQADAQFSIPYTVATAIRKRWVSLEDFQEAAVRDPAVGELASRVRVVVDPTIDERAVAPVTVRVRTVDGRTLESRAADTRGHAGNPLPREELEAKFRGCLAFSGRPEFQQRAERLIRTVEKLEELDDVRDLAALLVPQGDVGPGATLARSAHSTGHGHRQARQSQERPGRLQRAASTPCQG